MTLKTFLKKTGAYSDRYGGPSSVAVRVQTSGLSADERWDLFHLKDYGGASVVSGGYVVLVPLRT